MLGRTGILGFIFLFLAVGAGWAQTAKARAAYEAGLAQQAKGAHAEAVESFSAALTAGRTYPAALRARAVSYSVLGQDKAAIADLDQALAVKPDDMGAWNARGEIHLRHSEFEQAASDFSKVLGQHSDPMLRLRRGTAYRGLGRLAEARTDLDQAIAANPTDAEAYYQRGLVSVAEKQWGAAQNDLNRAIDINPDFVPAYLDRGLVRQQLGLHTEAIGDLTRYLRHAPNHTVALRARAQSYADHGDTALADADRRHAQEIEPEPVVATEVVAEKAEPAAAAPAVETARAPTPEPTQEAAVVAERKESPAQAPAEEHVSPVAQIAAVQAQPEPKPQQAVLIDATTVAQPASISKAPSVRAVIEAPPSLAALKKAARSDAPKASTEKTPETKPVVARPANVDSAGKAADAEAHNLKGRELNSQDQYLPAIAEFNQAVKLDPTLAQAWNSRGYAQLRIRRVREAISDFNQAIALNPNYKNAYHNRGIAKRAMRDTAGADADEAKAATLAGP